MGEILVTPEGEVARVLTQREVEFRLPVPALNAAIVSASPMGVREVSYARLHDDHDQHELVLMIAGEAIVS